MRRPFRQIDVFGEEPGTGNPVAVVLEAAGLSDDDMRRFSRWTNLSECTFVLPPTTPEADYRVRIFSLDVELPFAGHPTLGTARAWVDAGGTPATPGTVVQECGAGLIPVRVAGDVLAFEAPPLLRSGAVEPGLLARAIAVLGVDPAAVVAAEWLDNGPGWLGLLLDGADTVLALRPDAARAAGDEHRGRWDLGVIGAHPDGSAEAFEVRAFFSDGVGTLVEDPVTGSLNAAAAQWMLASGRATAPYVVRQGTALGRRGRVTISTDADGSAVWVGGRTDVVLSGTADLGGAPDVD
ncbi:PhzF family phenazine biosynthesis protein [Pseudolysinimonas sp.]|jgi:PhzF family phenazine biosynthesis protein|uniref:PhzF family phenazine biosynthesis protein n=1 Tax=Pseudolysinimonas sp. TaxID=2680009 RepID=UPI00378408CC